MTFIGHPKMTNLTITIRLLSVCLAFTLCSCTPVLETAVTKKQSDTSDAFTIAGKHNYVSGYEAVFKDGDVNVVVEIPTGSVEKWEVDKASGHLKWELEDGTPRKVDYLGYPGNYGMIPKTLLPKESGGDGDPLDVIVLGPAVPRGSVIKCKLIGVLRLIDRGEQDDKLIAVMEDTPFYSVDSIAELDADFVGASEIIELWFANYKGPGKMRSLGFADQDAAKEILSAAMMAYTNSIR